MTKVRRQILEVIRVIYSEWKLNPEEEPFRIPPEKLKPFPDHPAVLNKLERQYNVIEILHSPNNKSYGNADLGMFELEQGRDQVESYLSYHIHVKPSFEAFYKKHYADNSVNIPTLNTNNFWKVIDTAEQLDDQINISPSDIVILNANDTGSFWKNLKSSMNYTEIAGQKKKALEFLYAQNAITNYEFEAHEEYNLDRTTSIIENFTINVNRPVFAEVYEELKSFVNKHLNKGEEEKTKPQKHEIVFDITNEKLRNGEIIVDVGGTTIEFYILKALYEVPVGQGVNVTDVFDEWGGEEKKQTIYDAVTRINKKFRQLLGTTSKDVKVVFQKSSKLFFDKKYSDSISIQK